MHLNSSLLFSRMSTLIKPTYYGWLPARIYNHDNHGLRIMRQEASYSAIDLVDVSVVVF